jgi:hypothetical protein
MFFYVYVLRSIPETLKERMAGMWLHSNMKHEVDSLVAFKITEKTRRNKM